MVPQESHPHLIIGADHRGFDLKQYLMGTIAAQWQDMGCHDRNSCDYPDFAHAVAQQITAYPESFGILICGSGIGMSIAANRHPLVRAALCFHPELAHLARAKNHANVLCMGADWISPDMAVQCVRTFFTTAFEGGRHQRRVDKFEGF